MIDMTDREMRERIYELENERRKFLKEIGNLKNKVAILESGKKVVEEWLDKEETAHSETRKKYADVLKELIELREKLAGKVETE